MARSDIICGLDIGSVNTRVVVGQVGSGEDPNRAHILGVAEIPSEGVNKGIITSIEDSVSSISACLEKAERIVGLPIEKAIVNINGSHIKSAESHGVVAVSRADGEIKDDDIARVIEAAQTIATPPNYEILHVIPRGFTVDAQQGIKDPAGMVGIKLEVDAQIILGLSSQIKNLTKCIYRTGVDIEDLVLGGLAASESVLSKRQRDLGVALVDIGGSTTNLVVFEEGDMIHNAVFPIGAGHITNDIAIGLRISIEVAEKLKIEYGTALSADVPKREEINLATIDESEKDFVSRKHVAEIIEARLEEIFKMVNDELKKIERNGLLPAGIVLVGGGAKLTGVLEVAKKEFKLPAFVGIPQNVATTVDKVLSPEFACTAGLALWGMAGVDGSKKASFSIPRFSSVSDVTGKMKKWFKSLMP